MSNELLLHFIETSTFTKKLGKLADLNLLFNIQNDLIANPKLGDVMQGCGGARKARVANKQQNKGKSGSFRYIYIYLEMA